MLLRQLAFYSAEASGDMTTLVVAGVPVDAKDYPGRTCYWNKDGRMKQTTPYMWCFIAGSMSDVEFGS